jgi:citrate synthase
MNIEPTATLVEQIQGVLADALQIPEDQVSPDLAFGDLPQWDSMGHMEVMMSLETRFGIEINAETIAALTSIAAIRDYIQENGNA